MQPAKELLGPYKTGVIAAGVRIIISANRRGPGVERKACGKPRV